MKFTPASSFRMTRNRRRKGWVALLIATLAAWGALVTTTATAASADTMTMTGCVDFGGKLYLQGEFIVYQNGTVFYCLGPGKWVPYAGCGYGTQLFNFGDVRTDGDGNSWECISDPFNPDPPRGIWAPFRSGSIDPDMRHIQTQNGSPGLCIGVAGGSQAVNAAVVQGPCASGDHSQSWAQEAVSGDYGFLINWHSGLCIDVNSSGRLIQATCDTGATHMLWRKYTSGSGWEFQNDASGQVITVPGGYTIGGLQLGVYGDLHLAYQKWNLLPVNLA